MLARALAMWLAAVGLTGGCSSKPGPSMTAQTFQPLVALDDWSSVSRDVDPFIDADVPAACVGPGFRLEPDDNWLEIDTTLCHWVTLTGSARDAVVDGQLLQLTVSHYNLAAAAPAEARLELRFGTCQAWSKVIPIPSAAAVYDEQVSSPCALAADDSVLFHLDNHGQNTYQLQALSSLR